MSIELADRLAAERYADDRRVAVVVDPTLAPGLLANTVAVIAVGLGAARRGLAGDPLTDAEGRSFRPSSNEPVPVLQADSETIRSLLLKALPGPEGSAVVPFPAFGRSLHAFADYAALVPARSLATERIDGIGLAGPARWVRSLTGSLKLLR